MCGHDDPPARAADPRERRADADGGTEADRDTDRNADAGSSSRRAFLARAAAASAATASLAGCAGLFGGGADDPTSTPTESTPHPDTRSPTPVPGPFDSAIDLTERGADPTGETPIGEVVMDAAEEGGLLHLPSGEYLIDEIDVSGIDRFGLVGDGATLVPDPDASSTLVYANVDGPVLLRGLKFDFRADGVSARALDARAPDGLEIRDVTVRGRLDGGRGPVRVDVRSPDGTGVVERLQLPDGSTTEDAVTGCYIGDQNRGRVTFRDCRIEGFADNGLYAEPTYGHVTVEGGYYANNGISNVRVRAGSLVRDVHVRCDDGSSDFENMRGIRLANARPEQDAEPAVVENCLVEMLEVSYSDGAITVGSALPAAVVRDTEIRVDADDVPAIWAKLPRKELLDAETPPRFDCANLSVSGEADGGTAVQIERRDRCSLDTIDIVQRAANRNGILFQRSNDNVLRDADLDVGGTPIILSDATLTTHNINVGDRGISNQTAGEEDR